MNRSADRPRTLTNGSLCRQRHHSNPNDAKGRKGGQELLDGIAGHVAANEDVRPDAQSLSLSPHAAPRQPQPIKKNALVPWTPYGATGEIGAAALRLFALSRTGPTGARGAPRATAAAECGMERWGVKTLSDKRLM